MLAYPAMASDHRQQFIRFRYQDGSWRAHPDLNRKLVEEAQSRSTSRTEVILGILARAYDVAHDVPARVPVGTRPDEGAEKFNLRMPAALYQAVAMHALSNDRNAVDEIISTLCAHYGLRVPPPPIKTRRPRRAAA